MRRRRRRSRRGRRKLNINLRGRTGTYMQRMASGKQALVRNRAFCSGAP